MVKQNVLKTLYENLENCVSGEDIASKLNISKEELLDQIESLKDDGYVIESSDGTYCLRKTPNLLLPYELKRNLETEYMLGPSTRSPIFLPPDSVLFKGM